MKLITGDLWDWYNHDHIICITTNGTVKKDGSVVMGAGCALQAKQRFPLLPNLLGKVITNEYTLKEPLNIPFYFPDYRIITFPVKTHWFQKAEVELIAKIVKRMCKISPDANRLHAMMDIEVCHSNGNPLDLKALAESDTSDLIHDVCGITMNIDRTTGKLQNCFVPRFSKRLDL